ncbi:MAG: hypothetical protein SGJ11_02590 [Phycisphaerae bacterium]|nr:hypothetical protein [Phycisphaerae bacterium]
MKFAVLAGGLVAAIATVASADQAISLGNNTLTGGQSNTYVFNLSGALTNFSIAFNYVDGGPSEWSSDMILQIIDPNGASRHWGGFNVVPAPASTFVAFWSFDGSASTASGPYADVSNPAAGLSGNGAWTFKIYNGWTAGGPSQYNDVNINLVGLVPAPGAVALLGLAGLVGRRRRTA